MWFLLIPIAFLLFSEGTSLVANNPSYDDLFKRYAPKGIDWNVLKKIARIESHIGLAPSVAYGILNPTDIENSKSSDGLSWGLMQLRPSTARDFDPSATAQKLNNPEYSIYIAGLYINWCRSYLLRNTFLTEANPRFTEFLVKSYNQGVGNTSKEIKSGGIGFASAYWTKYKNLA